MSWRVCWRGICPAVGLIAAVSAAEGAPGPAAHWSPTERWVWSQVVRTNPFLGAFLDTHCNEQHPSPDEWTSKTWQHPCRRVSARFIADVLTSAPWRDAIPPSGLYLDGVFVDGSIDLRGSTIARALWFNNAVIDGSVILQFASTSSPISFVNTHVVGELNANELRSESGVRLTDGSTFTDVDLSTSRIGGRVRINATVPGLFKADSMRVGKGLDLVSSNGIRCSIGGIVLAGSAIDDDFNLVGVAVRGSVDAVDLTVSHTVRIARSGKEPVTIGGDLDLSRARIGEVLDLTGGEFADVRLSGAWIEGELRLGSKDSRSAPKSIDLRNARVGNFCDDVNAWPLRGHLVLDNFRFERLGCIVGPSGDEMRKRPAWWWDQWARLDSEYSPTPYAQLSSVFTSIGHRELGDAIRYLGRERERDAAWESGSILRWLVLSLLWIVAGHGIGLYSFGVLIWIVGLTVLGGGFLWTCVPESRRPGRGRLWCIGASLSRLLPIVKINAEFDHFFDDPERQRLTYMQSMIFSGMRIAGWILGAILIAALSGVTRDQ